MSEILLLSVFSGWETYSWESLNNIPQITQTYNGAKSCTGGSSLFSYKHIIPYCTVFMLRSIRQDRRKLSGKLIRCYCRNYNCFNLEDCMFLNIQTMSLPQFSSVQSLVMSDSLQLYGLQHNSSVLHCIPELDQTHVHWVGDAIQPSHPLSSPSPPAFSFSWHHSLVQWVSSSHQVAQVNISPSNEYSGKGSQRLTGLTSLQSKGLSRVFSNTTVHQFFGTQPSSWTSSHIHTWFLEKL